MRFSPPLVPEKRPSRTAYPVDEVDKKISRPIGFALLSGGKNTSTTPLYNALTQLGLVRDDAKEVADGWASAEDVATKVEPVEVKSDVKTQMDGVATKMDLVEVKTQIAKVETRIAELKVFLLIAMAVYTGVGVGVVTFLIKI